MKTFYLSINQYLQKHPAYRHFIALVTKFSVYPFYGLYPAILVYLYMTNNDLLIEVTLKPFFMFLFVTLFRKMINRPRPYDQLPITPIEEHKQGESFPSRHSASAFIIALMIIKVSLPLGIFALLCAIIVALSRLLGGLHYLSDIVAAILLSALLYFI